MSHPPELSQAFTSGHIGDWEVGIFNVAHTSRIKSIFKKKGGIGYMYCPVVSASEKAMAPTPVLLPGKSHGWRSLVGCSPWGR